MPKKSSLLSTLEKHRISIPVHWTEAIWQRLYERHRPVERDELFFRLIPFASVIEQVYRDRGVAITRKESLDTLAKIAAKQVYEDECGDEETMLVFFKHNVLRYQYDWYKKLRIEEDDQQIPQIDLPGSEISEDHASFRLTKLSKHDPRAVLVGKYTGCCEVIGGIGQGFLKIALTQSFAGYYVLLDERQPIHKRIVAHSIAWRVGDAMVYSSIETNINYRDRLPLIADFYYMLAKKLILNHAINTVHIWEWHALTPPMLRLYEKLPLLNERIDSTFQRLNVDLGRYAHLKIRACIADSERPFLNVYSKFRQYPALSFNGSDIQLKPFTQSESEQVFSAIFRSTASAQELIQEGQGEINRDLSEEMTIRYYLQECGATEDQLAINFDDFVKLNHHNNPKKPKFTPNECLLILGIAKNTNGFIVPDFQADLFSVFTRAQWVLSSYTLMAPLFEQESLTRALSLDFVTEVVKGFYYSDGVRVPFSSVDLMSKDSLVKYLGEFLDFCVLIQEFRTLCANKVIDKSRFDASYPLVADRHPVTCMVLLREAIRDGHHTLVNLLLDAGMDVNNDQEFPETPLVLAIEKHDNHLVSQLIAHGADVNLRARGPASIGWCPLESAIWDARNESIFKLLIINGAKIDFHSERDHSNLLHHVSNFKASFWVRYLIIRGLNPNTLSGSLFDTYGSVTPLYKAARADRMDIFKRLVKYGADINFKNERGLTMLHYAVLALNLRVVQYFVDAGADVTMKDSREKTPADLLEKYAQDSEDARNCKTQIMLKLTEKRLAIRVSSSSATMFSHHGGVLSEPCASVLSEFFKARR